MVTRETIKSLAAEFLTEVRDAVESGLGDDAYHNPRSLYRTSTRLPGGGLLMEVMEPELREFDSNKLDIWCQQNLLGPPLVENESANIERLKHALRESGIDRLDAQPYLRRLIRHWCALEDPYRFPADSKGLREEFANAVVDGQVETESIDGIAYMTLPDGPIELDDEVTVRPITQDELITFGRELFRDPWQTGNLPYPHGPESKLIPDTRWVVLAVNVSHRRDGHPEEAKLRHIVDAFLIGAAFCKQGGFAYLPYSHVTNYGSIGAGNAKPFSQVIGSPAFDAYELDRDTGQKLRDAWPKLLQIVRDDGSYLGTAARRLVDGLGRIKLEDSVIDFSIGLEALLSDRDPELSYRTSMRGGYMMAWEGGEINKPFAGLRSLYSARSRIVHGDKVSRIKLRESRQFGEQALREIWWWFLNQGGAPKDAIQDKIDERIESRSFPSET